MGFVKVEKPAPETCYCHKPNSNGGKKFGKNTIWRCDKCGRAWRLGSWNWDTREGYYYDNWLRSEAHDGPDNRPIPVVPEVEATTMVVYEDDWK